MSKRYITSQNRNRKDIEEHWYMINTIDIKRINTRNEEESKEEMDDR